MSNTKVVYINSPYILTPVPTLYDYSSPRYDQQHVFDLSVTYDLNLWPKILKIILHNEDSTSNMYVKFQNNRIKTVLCRARSRMRTEPDRQTHRQREHYSLSARLIIQIRDNAMLVSDNRHIHVTYTSNIIELVTWSHSAVFVIIPSYYQPIKRDAFNWNMILVSDILTYLVLTCNEFKNYYLCVDISYMYIEWFFTQVHEGMPINRLSFDKVVFYVRSTYYYLSTSPFKELNNCLFSRKLNVMFVMHITTLIKRYYVQYNRRSSVDSLPPGSVYYAPPPCNHKTTY